jgi:hypothetical protein
MQRDFPSAPRCSGVVRGGLDLRRGLMDVLMPSQCHGVPVLAFRSIGSTRAGQDHAAQVTRCKQAKARAATWPANPSTGRERRLRRVDASTPVAYPQVVSRTFGSFRVATSDVSARQRQICSGFDSRQLHQKGRRDAALLFSAYINPARGGRQGTSRSTSRRTARRRRRAGPVRREVPCDR